MRDFRDAKAMAHSLRDALKAKTFVISHSESLELIAKAFGFENWNVLSARISTPPDSGAAARPPSPSSQQVLYCSFCGKSQHDVVKLIAGPAVYICDECVDVCIDIADDQLLELCAGDAEAARAMSTDRLLHYVEHAKKGQQRNRLVVEQVDQMLELRRDAAQMGDDMLMSSKLIHLKNKTTDELLALRDFSRAQLARYERAMNTAMPVLRERQH